MHMFAAFYFVIILSLEQEWKFSYDELISLWTLGALLIGLGALPAGLLSDRSVSYTHLTLPTICSV